MHDPALPLCWSVTGTCGEKREIEYHYDLQIPRDESKYVERLTLNGEPRISARWPGERDIVPQGFSTAIAPIPYLAHDVHAGQDVDRVRKDLLSVSAHSFVPSHLRLAGTSGESPVLSRSGDNLATVVKWFREYDEEGAFSALKRSLTEVASFFRQLRVLPAGHRPVVLGPTRFGEKQRVGERDFYALNYVFNGDGSKVELDAAFVSDGVLLLTAYLALAHGSGADRLMIEEPENGVHPEAIEFLLDMFHKMSTGELGGHARQILLTTHNPVLLNHLEPEEVLIFTRSADGAARVTPMAESKTVKTHRKEFGAGELWHLLGEEALIRGADVETEASEAESGGQVEETEPALGAEVEEGPSGAESGTPTVRHP